MGDETVILVVDDDHAVLESMQLLLEEVAHFRVLCAKGARGAYRYFADREPIDVIIADVILSGEITGIDICQRAREIYPDVALVVISADPGAEKESMPDAGAYLRKPFGGRELLAAIEQTIASAGAPSARETLKYAGVDVNASESVQQGLRHRCSIADGPD